MHTEVLPYESTRQTWDKVTLALFGPFLMSTQPRNSALPKSSVLFTEGEFVALNRTNGFVSNWREYSSVFFDFFASTIRRNSQISHKSSCFRSAALIASTWADAAVIAAAEVEFISTNVWQLQKASGMPASSQVRFEGIGVKKEKLVRFMRKRRLQRYEHFVLYDCFCCTPVPRY